MPLLEPVGEVLRVDLAVELLYLAVSGDVDELLVDIVGELLPKSVNRLAVVLDLMEGRGLAVGDDVGGLLLLRNGLVDLNTVGVDLDGAWMMTTSPVKMAMLLFRSASCVAEVMLMG